MEKHCNHGSRIDREVMVQRLPQINKHQRFAKSKQAEPKEAKTIDLSNKMSELFNLMCARWVTISYSG